MRALPLLVVLAASLTLAGCTGGGGVEPSPSATDDGQANASDIKVGDCLNDSDVEDEVTTVPIVDCTLPHDREAYSSIILSDGSFPGADVIKQKAIDGCTTDFNNFVGVNYDQSTLSFAYYYPTTESWANGDRQILCMIFDPAGKTTGSLDGAAK